MSGYIGTQPVPQATQTRDSFTATSGQTSFATGGYTPNFLDVYLNGVKLAAADYTATNGSDVVLASGAATGDILEVVAFTTFTPADLPDGTPSIDDNGNATALTIDSSENVLVGLSAEEAVGTNAGTQLRANGLVYAAVTSDAHILSRRSTDGAILNLRKDTTTVGSIGTNGSTLYIGSTEGADAYLGFGNQIIRPVTSSGASRDNAIDLGYNGMRFRDAYLSGGVYLGGTGSANKLEDYEEGTWTPAFQSVTVSNYASQQGKYTKIGSLVNCTVSIDVSSGLDTSDGSGVKINLPFTAIANEEAAVVSLGRYINILGSKATSVNNYRLSSSSLLLYQAHDSSITYNTINSGGFLQMAFTYRTSA